MEESLIADRGNGTTGVATESLGALDTFGFQFLLYVRHEFLGVNLRQAEIDDALYAEGKSHNETKRYQRHETCSALQKLVLELGVSATFSQRIDGKRVTELQGGIIKHDAVTHCETVWLCKYTDTDEEKQCREYAV